MREYSGDWELRCKEEFDEYCETHEFYCFFEGKALFVGWKGKRRT